MDAIPVGYTKIQQYMHNVHLAGNLVSKSRRYQTELPEVCGYTGTVRYGYHILGFRYGQLHKGAYATLPYCDKREHLSYKPVHS